MQTVFKANSCWGRTVEGRQYAPGGTHLVEVVPHNVVGAPRGFGLHIIYISVTRPPPGVSQIVVVETGNSATHLKVTQPAAELGRYAPSPASGVS